MSEPQTLVQIGYACRACGLGSDEPIRVTVPGHVDPTQPFAHWKDLAYAAVVAHHDKLAPFCPNDTFAYSVPAVRVN